jgi:aryl-alcohol dehydrogenase-like predicted oxidoreductase
VYDRPEVFGFLDELVKAGKVRYYGISVESVEEAVRGIRHPGVQSVQIIFNMLRLKPAEAFFPAAKQRGVGILARVPLASGLLSGKLTKQSTFARDDHRAFNRNGEAFDKGETFAGVPFDVGLEVVERLRPLVPAGATLAQLALRFTLMFDAVSCAIPGAKTPEQARANAAAADLPPLPPATLTAVRQIYDDTVRPLVHASW